MSRRTRSVLPAMVALIAIAVLGCDIITFGSPFETPQTEPFPGTGDEPPAEDPQLSSSKEITAFSFTKAANAGLPFDIVGTIAGTQIDGAVPLGNEVDALVASFTTTGASLTVGDVEQVSAVTANDFSAPVTYTVTAEDGSTADYTVTVTQEMVPLTTPILSPVSGTEFYPELSVDITNRQPGAVYRYTSGDGTQAAPASASDGVAFDTAITVTSSVTIKAVGFIPGFDSSDVVSAAYTGRVPSPTLTPTPGTYSDGQLVEATTYLTGVDYRYTTGDGSQPDPTTGDADFAAGAPVGLTRTIKVRAFRAGFEASSVVVGAYEVTTVWVDGSPGGDGSKAAPFEFIQQGIDAAINGYTVRVAGGVYAEIVTLKEGVILEGGWAAGFATRDDPAIHRGNGPNETRIADPTAGGGTITDPLRAVYAYGAGITTAAVVEGVKILGSTIGDFTSGVFCKAGASPTIRYSTIDGGLGTTRSYGVYLDGSSPTIEASLIVGGGGGQAYGIRMTASAPNIVGNEINGGAASNTNSAGIFCDAGSDPFIGGNAIHGGAATGTSSAIFLNSAGVPIIENNTLDGGNGGGIVNGIYTASSDGMIVNNTIKAQNALDAPAVYGVRITGTGIAPIKVVNVIIDISGTGSVTGLRVDGGATPPEISYSCVWTNSGTGIDGAIDPGSILNQVDTFNPALGGPDGFHLTGATPLQVKQGGVDTYTGVSIPPVGKDGATRTVPLSMGAYEYDL